MLLSKQSLADASATTILGISTTATAAAESIACDTDRAIYFGEISRKAKANSCPQSPVNCIPYLCNTPHDNRLYRDLSDAYRKLFIYSNEYLKMLLRVLSKRCQQFKLMLNKN